MADPRFAKSRFTSGVKRANTSDPRYAPSVRQGAPEPRKFSAEGRAGDDAFRESCFQESMNRMNYQKGVVVEKSPTAREE